MVKWKKWPEQKPKQDGTYLIYTEYEPRHKTNGVIRQTGVAEYKLEAWRFMGRHIILMWAEYNKPNENPYA